jgi:hypothetical protein
VLPAHGLTRRCTRPLGFASRRVSAQVVRQTKRQGPNARVTAVLMDPNRAVVRIGRLTRDGTVVGYLAVDNQDVSSSQRRGFRARRWSETRRRCRLVLIGELPDWGYLETEDEAALDVGQFTYKGETLAHEDLVGAERQAVSSQVFSGWD